MIEHTIPNALPIKDSGKREEFQTGSRRDTREGKGRFDLLPTRGLKRLARHFENGAKKYGDRNWEKGQSISRYVDSGIRHSFTYLEGQRDEDHLIAGVWNLICAADTEERIKAGLLPKELDDCPKLEPVVYSEEIKQIIAESTLPDERLAVILSVPVEYVNQIKNSTRIKSNPVHKNRFSIS